MSSPTLRKRFKPSDGFPPKRSRSNSRGKLEDLYRLLDATILDHQVCKLLGINHLAPY